MHPPSICLLPSVLILSFPVLVLSGNETTEVFFWKLLVLSFLLGIAETFLLLDTLQLLMLLARAPTYLQTELILLIIF